ncbi:helix-turn-helix transcriptional regulator|uniref:helix-turn-helix domain-containing protein n=1 Tax=Noviherbaspirillum sp. L7-7A TaxID=2850560 RepID=UPI001C2C6DFF|nr:helix-turn-helix transcriptional regulator [Noviherbaspirillum sp. L7-7A]MBV0880585.1 helix-turn-helix transcriptional regulator [Noviherbaspirillum sp. L7-7A]
MDMTGWQAGRIGQDTGRPAAEGLFRDFAQALRYWRARRGYSQLRLSAESGISQRHISFLESGRSQPSRELILRLGNALDMPLRQRNAMLLAAGFAPAYRERSLTDPELAAVRRALDFMLTQQAPYPALVVDRLWNLVMLNQPARRLMGWLLNLAPGQALPTEGVNVIRLMLDAHGIRPCLPNWQEVCADLLHWVQREAMADGPGSEATRLLESLLALPGVRQAARAVNPDSHALPFMTVTLHKGDTELRLFTTIATMGTPRDVTVHELRIESFFPADAGTAAWFQAQVCPDGASA